MNNPVIHSLAKNQALMTVAFVLLVLLMWKIAPILITLFISFTIMSALYPFVDFLRKAGFPQGLSATIVYLLVLCLIALLVFSLVPFFTAQIQLLFKTFPFYLNKTAQMLGFEIDNRQVQSLLTSELGQIGENALQLTKSLFSGFFTTLTVIVISFYMLLERSKLHKAFITIFPKSQQPKAMKLIQDIELKLGAWVRGQTLLSFAVGTVTWITLTLLGIDFALPLALFAGILEIVPTIGPILSAVPALIVAFAISPTLMFVVVAAYIAIQMLENNILVPKIMEKAVGLNPIVVITSVAIGASMLGVLGALLAIPFLSVLIIVVKALHK
ncbi:MAG: AI-2E family transporter [Candidatus Levybacteria bacterium]|nr:AI-2E family transporter [Candidatus Levybacteria bacterium]